MNVRKTLKFLVLLVVFQSVLLEGEIHRENDTPTSYCTDDPEEARFCPVWKRWGACSYISDRCAKTCEFCTVQSAPPVPFIPKCARTQYGCCWDNKTTAKGPSTDLVASQCPPCMDRQSRRFCFGWRDKCGSEVKGQGDVMRQKCPSTCKVPCKYSMNVHANTCTDREEYKQDCLRWFHQGKCRTHKGHMRRYCPMSCGYCKVLITW